MPGGEIVTNFVEAKGMHPTNATFTFPVLATTDGGDTTRYDWVVLGDAKLTYEQLAPQNHQTSTEGDTP